MSILDFIGGPWGALIGKVLMGLTLAATIYVAVSQYNAAIAKNERMKNENAQLTQLVKDNEELKNRLYKLEEINGQILLRLDAQNTKVIEKHDSVTKYIQSPEGKSTDRPASNVIKNTIGMLRD